MAYTQPTVSTLKARFPEFADLDIELLDLVLQECITEVGDTWVENDRAQAQMLLCAHRLVTEGHSSNSAAGSGPVKSMRVGDVEVQHATGMDSGWTSNPQLGNNLVAYPGFYMESLSATVYGLRYLRLQMCSFPRVASA